MKKTFCIEERFDSQEIVCIYNIIYVYIYIRKMYKARIGESEKENSLIHNYNEKF